MKNINLFISSTCYDLSQVRADLNDFIGSLGHNPMLSEFNKFPIDPSLTTIENCIRAVNEDSDIFVLIVGNRYGSIIDKGHSITNAEYSAARGKGIPIYIFIDKKTLNILPVWSKNKDGDFSNIVDNTKIFEFIEELRSQSNHWTFEFEKAQDIIDTLRVQLSYIFKESLHLKQKFEVSFDLEFSKNLSPKALEIIITKPELFELEFFIQTLNDEMLNKSHIKKDYEYQIFMFSNSKIFDLETATTWARSKIQELMKIIKSINNLIYQAFPKYYGEPGIPSDLKGLYYVSKTYSKIFEQILAWSIDNSSSTFNEEYQQIITR